MIYAMREVETGLYKIGMARSESIARRERLPSIAKRRGEKLGRQCTIEFLIWVDWPHTAEMDLHRYLWQSWAGDEWFSDSQRLREVLAFMRNRADYFGWRRAFREVETSLPRRWHWRNRDKILTEHRARNTI